MSRHDRTLQRLRQQMQSRSFREPSLPDRSPLDSFLPELRGGMLMELLSSSSGGGASLVAFLIARQLQPSRSLLVIVDSHGEFSPVGASGVGVSLAETVVIRPPGQRDRLWALEQALRSPARATVVCPLKRVTTTAYRRLKLAAERGGSRGLLLRPASTLAQPSWADVRVLVTPVPTQPSEVPVESRRVRLEVVHARGGRFEQKATLIEIDHEAHVMPVAAELAHPAAVDRSA